MSIGPDIKEVLEEIGSPFTILRTTTISGEYLRHKPNKQVTKPFILEFFLETELAYDTQVVPGDVINVPTLNSKYLVMHRQGLDLEGEVYKYDSILYKANVSGEILREVLSGDDDADFVQTYHRETVWTSVKTTAYGLLTESFFGNELDQQDFAQLKIARNELYLPSSYGIRVMDRYSPASGEYYKVTAVKKRVYSSVDVVNVEEDTRQ